MTLIGLAKATQIAAAASSILLARRRAEHVPAAVALVILAAVALIRGPLNAGPHHGVTLYFNGAAELATYATVAGLACAVAVSAEHRPRVLAVSVVVWGLGSIALALYYASPGVTGPTLQRIYLAADLIGLFVSAAALFAWAARKLAAKRSPDSASLVALGLVALDATILLAPFSPWRGVVYGSDFSGIQLAVVVFFAAFAAVQVWAWIRSSRPG